MLLLLALQFLGYSTAALAEPTAAAVTSTRKMSNISQQLRGRQETSIASYNAESLEFVVQRQRGETDGTIISQRKLAFEFLDFNVGDSLDRLFSTPISEWTWGQWLLGCILLFLVLWCCGCVASGTQRRYHRRTRYDESYRSRSEPILVD
jgi:hypothetical protein